MKSFLSLTTLLMVSLTVRAMDDISSNSHMFRDILFGWCEGAFGPQRTQFVNCILNPQYPFNFQGVVGGCATELKLPVPVPNANPNILMNFMCENYGNLGLMLQMQQCIAARSLTYGVSMMELKKYTKECYKSSYNDFLMLNFV